MTATPKGSAANGATLSSLSTAISDPVGAALGTNVGAGVDKAPSGTAPVNVSDAHDMVIAIGLELLFVYVIVVIAGTSPGAGKAALAFMVVLLMGQAVTHGNPLTSYLTKHPTTV